jgi:hypothetical protein
LSKKDAEIERLNLLESNPGDAAPGADPEAAAEKI